MSKPAKNQRKDASKNNDFDLWVERTREITSTDNPLNVPYEVGLQEAVGLARFMRDYWEPTDERPGLASVKQRLPLAVADEILSLVRAVQDAQTRALLLVDPVVVNLGDRARFVVEELESAIEFLLDDNVKEPADEQLARLKEFHSQDGQRSSALAQSLRDYGALADSLRDRLVAADEAFDTTLIDESARLAVALMQPVETQANGDGSAALVTRNRMLHLLVNRMTLVRRTAAHVFRRHPEILRQATSAYERRRRAAARREKLRQTPPAAPSTPANG